MGHAPRTRGNRQPLAPRKHHLTARSPAQIPPPLNPIAREGDPKWDDITKWKPVVTLNQQEVKLIHAGLTDLSMANVDDLPLGLGRGTNIHMPRVLRAFFVLEPPKDMKDIDMTCELHDAEGKATSERWVYLWKRPK